MNLYIASSWRNEDYLAILAELKAKHECYDFRDPVGRVPGVHAFSWAAIDAEWQNWTLEEYRENLRSHELARAAFASDYAAVQDADAVVLVQPAGVSAHLEAALAVGLGKPVVSVGTPREPDLMLAMVDAILGRHELPALDAWLEVANWRQQMLTMQLAGKQLPLATRSRLQRALRTVLPLSTPLGVRRLQPLLTYLSVTTDGGE